ncbi:MAG: hypothetical protein JSR46_11355 [Verrucomicrobia bacterium]|nr:hypothetical protein [Verrucomicrobiota bacterium]
MNKPRQEGGADLHNCKKEMAKVFKRDGSSLGRMMQRFSEKYACSVAIQIQSSRGEITQFRNSGE